MSKHQSLKGQFLIATRGLRDPNFFKTVVLIVEHNEAGAMGLVVNRPSSISVAKALQGHFELPDATDLVYNGGPVEQSNLFILHNASELDDSESPVVPDIFIGSSADVFEEVVQRAAQGDKETKFRVFFGCAGWTPGQLESELRRTDWYVLDATHDLVYHPDPYSVWDLAMSTYRATHPLLDTVVAHPEWN